MKDEQAIHPAMTSRAPAMDSVDRRRWSAAQPKVATQVFLGLHDQVARARAFVRAVLGPVPVVDEVVLLVSELCTNALLHTASGHGGTFEVAVYSGPLSVRVEVRDGGAAQAPGIRQLADTCAEEGRGLGLAELLADHWGHSGDENGRSVFFELHWKPPD